MADSELTITIKKTDEKYGWEVRCGDRYQDQLGPDEALWCIANLLMSEKRTYPSWTYLRTKEEHDAINAQFGIRKPLEPWQKQLAPVEA